MYFTSSLPYTDAPKLPHLALPRLGISIHLQRHISRNVVDDRCQSEELELHETFTGTRENHFDVKDYTTTQGDKSDP